MEDSVVKIWVAFLNEVFAYKHICDCNNNCNSVFTKTYCQSKEKIGIKFDRKEHEW